MRVLHVIPSLDPSTGGPARSVPALCRALQAAGASVALYTFRNPYAPVTVSTDETFNLHQFKPLYGSREFPSPDFYSRIRRDVCSFDLAHLHSLWNPSISLAALACRRAGIPYLLSPRGMLQGSAVGRRRRLKSVYHRLWERSTIAGARAIHFCTDAEAQSSRRFLPRHKPFAVIRNGVEPVSNGLAGACEFREAFPSLQGKRIALFLGRLHWSKGLELQAEALALAVREFPELVWVLVGPDEGEWAHLSRQVARLGLEKHVLRTGPLPHARCLEALKAADLFLLTSRHEAHSMAMNEALAVGVPLVIADTVRFPEIRECGAGYVVPGGPQPLAEAISSILKHPEQARGMREAGRRFASERLAWAHIARDMIEAYEEVLAPVDQRERQIILRRIGVENI
ncbi:MAG TPA: glycosyltransferase [Pyrinomonadaceae bacterium]|jgi:glycosyltransferase involved in cell wall biosynthesis|nr:glycosyltransferase [Pyrinomonadaceae bacterium]